MVIYFCHPDILAVFLSHSLDVIFNIKKIGNLVPNLLVILFALGTSLHVTQLNGLPKVFRVQLVPRTPRATRLSFLQADNRGKTSRKDSKKIIEQVS